MWMYESRLDDFLSAVGGGQAMLCNARGEARRAECGQKGDVEPRVEASVVVCGVSDQRRANESAHTYERAPSGVTHSVKGSSAFKSAMRPCCLRNSLKRVFPVWIDSRAASKTALLGGEPDGDVARSSPVSSKVSRIAVI